jgi:hypothetical protein
MLNDQKDLEIRVDMLTPLLAPPSMFGIVVYVRNGI